MKIKTIESVRKQLKLFYQMLLLGTTTAGIIDNKTIYDNQINISFLVLKNHL